VPIYGKLADLRGRKPIMLFGVGLFVLGSILCGIAWSMPALIAFRLIQGLGAGAVQPIGMTIVGDIYTVAERAKVQGYIASVWGIASFVGPTLGGVFSDYLSWRWIFFVNVPLGIAAAWVLVRRFQENVGRTAKHQIDYAGAVLLAIGGSMLLLGLLEGGVIWAWDSDVSIAILAAAAVLLTAFVLVERRAAEPILPLWVLRMRVLNSANAAALLIGVLMIGLSTYVPLFAQGVLGTSALVAGFALAAMTLGWPIAASAPPW
jgi:MFS family permease